MPPTREAERAARLGASLRALSVEIDRVDVAVRTVAMPSYPGGRRPTSQVALRGAGREGRGEHVGWTLKAHRAFARRAAGVIPRGSTTIDALSRLLSRRAPDPYDRAALEAAAIDLALRQAGLGLSALIGATPSTVRYVVSFAPKGDPVREMETLFAESPPIEVKLDTDETWTDETFTRLAETQRVAILDWKRSGTPARHALASRRLPEALLEDPGPDPTLAPPAIASRRSLDAPFCRADSLAKLPLPAAANVKPARMGGVLEAIDGVAWCAARGVPSYFGGMFEIGPARRQLLELAALLSPEGPNDIAPIPAAGRPTPVLPSRLAPPGGEGFGA